MRRALNGDSSYQMGIKAPSDMLRSNLCSKVKKLMDIDKNSNIKIIADKDKTIVLQTIALLDNLSPKMNQLADNLLDTSFRKWDKAIKGLNKAVELLVEMGVVS